MVSHEIGHSLGSGHTFDAGAYSPPVDTCGITCPESLPKESSATIMVSLLTLQPFHYCASELLEADESNNSYIQ